MEQSSGIKAWQWVVTIIVIIVLIIIGVMVFGDKSDDTATTDDTTTTTDDATINEVNRVVIGDQFPGNVVFLQSVQLANGGWVAIHKDNAGKPGAVIGSMYFDKGINTGKITLTQSTVDGGIYYAMLHTDDGDKVFSETKDEPLKDSKGAVIMRIFRASAEVTAGIKG